MCEQDSELGYLREQIKLEREVALEQGGLSGDLNASMAKFALAQIGWSEKQEVKQESNVTNKIDTEGLTDEELRTLAEIQRKSGASQT